MQDLTALIDQLIANFRPWVSTTSDDEHGLTLDAAAVVESYTGITREAAAYDGGLRLGMAVPLLNEDGEEAWARLDGITPDRLERALVYAAGEAAALSAELDEVTARGIALLRLKSATQKAS